MLHHRKNIPPFLFPGVFPVPTLSFSLSTPTSPIVSVGMLCVCTNGGGCSMYLCPPYGVPIPYCIPGVAFMPQF